MKPLSVTRAVYAVLDELPEGRISGRELQYRVTLMLEDKDPYHSTVLDKARTYCDIAGASLVCVDRKRSIYQFSPGHKIATAIIEGRE